MSYPAPPWNLQGFSLQALHLIDVDRVRPLIPDSLSILSIFPGKAIGGIYVASYESGSILKYNELIVVSALVYTTGKIGAWISHIYVDQLDSVAGGREIWGLPKQMAQFNWKQDKTLSVQVQQDGKELCTLSSQWQLPTWRQSLKIPVFSLMNDRLLTFQGDSEFKLFLAQVGLAVPQESPFAGLNLGNPWLGFYCNPIHLVAGIPSHLSSDT